MCSIIGYYGKNLAAPILVKGLEKMEYRGYDSVGVATKSENQILVKKGTGKVIEVNKSIQLDSLPGMAGIGHTRWATHGKVNDKNAHPHPSNSGKIAIVHNGIIENFNELKEKLLADGFEFKSETDTEVIANLIQQNFDKTHDIKQTMTKTVSQLKGHYTFVVIFEDGTLVGARFHEPLIVGVGKNSYYLASDVLGFIEKTDDAIYVENENFVMINNSGLHIYNFDGTEVKNQITKVSKEFADVYKGDYAHFTLKEISEQPETILRAGDDAQIDNMIKHISESKNLYVTGSGTSYNAARISKYLMSNYAKLKIEPIISSELPFSPDSIETDSTLITISQSGESADVLEAVKIAKESNAKILSIVNHLNSSLSQESDVVIGLNCGPEIGVAGSLETMKNAPPILRVTEATAEHE